MLEEHIIIKPENGTPATKTSTPTRSTVGARSLRQICRKINGKWWVVAGFHKGASSANGGWCNNTILIRTPATSSPSRMADSSRPRNWGEPTVLEGAAY